MPQEERLIAEQENKLRVLREKLRREELNQLGRAGHSPRSPVQGGPLGTGFFFFFSKGTAH